MLNKIKYIKDNNFIHIIGTLKNVPDYCRYVNAPELRPLVSFDLESSRRTKGEQEAKIDTIKGVLFDDEEFIVNFKDGDRVEITGEIQSRNYKREEDNIDEMYKMAVKNYIDLFEKFPSFKNPTKNRSFPISWKKLLSEGMIPRIPADSMYNEKGKKNKSKETPYVYTVDIDGNVHKESEHVSNEILVKTIKKIEDGYNPEIGDFNKSVLIGKITRVPFYNTFGENKDVPFLSFNMSIKSDIISGKRFYINIIAWGELAKEAYSEISKGTIVKVSGRIQSRVYNKEITKRWVTPAGNKKKKKIELNLVTHEVSASKIQLCIRPENIKTKETIIKEIKSNKTNKTDNIDEEKSSDIKDPLN